MTQHTHQTAPTRCVEANGIRFAYRRFGKPGATPLAQGREVILFDNAGVASSSGELVSEQTVAAQRAAIGKYVAYREAEGYLD